MEKDARNRQGIAAGIVGLVCNLILGAGKLVVFCNAPEDNPFMAGAFHGVGEADCVINVGVSGPGVVRSSGRCVQSRALCTLLLNRGSSRHHVYQRFC